MATLQKLTLGYNDQRDRWDLRDDRSGRLVRSFNTKREAVSGIGLRSAVEGKSASVKIQKVNGRFQEERTYPRSADPKGSRG